VRSRPESLVSDCSTPALQPPKLRWKMATGGRAGSHRCKLGRGSSSTTRSAGTTHMQSVPPQTYSLSSLLRINITSSSYILTLTHFVRPSPNLPEKLLQYKIYLPLFVYPESITTIAVQRSVTNCNFNPFNVHILLLLVCVSFTIIGQPRNSVLIRRV